MARGTKKQRIRPYTLIWYLELVHYAHILYGWGVEKTVGFMLVVCVSIICWLFPTLKRQKDAKYYEHYGVGFWEYYYKEWRHNPLDPYIDGRGMTAVSFTFVLYFSLVVWLLDTVLSAILGFSVLQEIHSTYEKVSWGVLMAVVATIFLFSAYLEWDDRHVAYIEDFEDRFSAFQKFFIWLFGSLPMVVVLLFLLLIILELATGLKFISL